MIKPQQKYAVAYFGVAPFVCDIELALVNVN